MFWTVDKGDVSNKFIFPIVRDGYKRAFLLFSKWVLDTKSDTGGEEGGQGQRGERDMQRILMWSFPGGRADRGPRTVGLADNCSCACCRDVVEERFLGGNVARMNKARKHEVMERVH